MSASLRLAPPVLALLGLCACSRDDADVLKPVDPVASQALAGPMLTEPDLAAMNGAARALGGNGVAAALIPANLPTLESIEAARNEAKSMAGGSLQPTPAGSGTASAIAGETALHSLRRAYGRVPCENAIGWSAIWAARLPDPAAIYPRGHVADALGADAQGCKLRAVTFRSGNRLNDILDFYWTRTSRAGFAPQHVSDGDSHAIRGVKGGLSITVYVKPGPEGLTEVHLVTKGG